MNNQIEFPSSSVFDHNRRGKKYYLELVFLYSITIYRLLLPTNPLILLSTVRYWSAVINSQQCLMFIDSTDLESFSIESSERRLTVWNYSWIVQCMGVSMDRSAASTSIVSRPTKLYDLGKGTILEEDPWRYVCLFVDHSFHLSIDVENDASRNNKLIEVETHF